MTPKPRKLDRRPLSVLVSQEIWKALDDASQGKPPYPRIRCEKSAVVEEALRQYLLTLETITRKG